ncbi:MAG: hypothetical protein IJE70_01195 [Oscillospiraceae bacterium]|nr:hypothetical protein [Oscillospiraceae bacterium]MBQ6902345.1 hypothetical protein [Oscillospiraceae bacterium]
MSKYCVYCGTQMGDSQLFCGSCGKKAGEASGENTYQSTGYASPEENANAGKGIKKYLGILAAVLFAVGLVASIIIGVSMEIGKKEQLPDAQNETYAANDYTQIKDEPEISEAEEVEQEIEFSIGEVTPDGVYENKYFGIRCELFGWTYLDREELLANTQIAKDNLLSDFDDERFTEILKEADSFMDMAAFHENGRSNVNIMIQKTLASDYNKFSEETMMRVMAMQLEEYYKLKGTPLDSCEVIKTTVNGTEKAAMHLTQTQSGITAYSIQFYIAKPNHSAVMTVTAASKEECLKIADSVYFS